jgi:hypothetical protein
MISLSVPIGKPTDVRACPALRLNELRAPRDESG